MIHFPQKIEFEAPQLQLADIHSRQSHQVTYGGVLKSSWIALSHGLQHFFCRINFQGDNLNPLQYPLFVKKKYALSL